MTVLSLDGVLPVVVLAMLWGGALVGVLLKLVWLGAPRRLVATVYVVLGGSGSCCCPRRCAPRRHRPGRCCSWRAERCTRSARSSTCASARTRAPPVFGFHEIFHVFVIAAALAHFVAIAAFVVPRG